MNHATHQDRREADPPTMGDALEGVTLVIPGRNTAQTLPDCLDAVTPLLGKNGLQEIIYVDDGSSDPSRDIAARYPVRVLRGTGKGAASARNLGWRAASTPLIWFMDADCQADPAALQRLRTHLDQHPEAGGAGGSFTNSRPYSLVACLIHEEIAQRHRRMPDEVCFLASGNVMYRRDVLESVRGFDETCYWAHDADLAFRVRRSGRRLRFEPQSLVGHAHPTRLLPYLNKQRLQGYYRVLLYLRHPERISGDSYSGMTDHLQPPLAMLIVASLPLLALPWFRWLPVLLIGLLLLAQAPMTFQTVRATRQAKYLLYAPMSFLRAFYRGVGMMQAVVVESLARAFQSNRKGPLSPSSP